MTLSMIENLGKRVLSRLENVGLSFVFLLRILSTQPRWIKSFPLMIEQMYAVGVQSFVIILVSGLFVGMVIALQGFIILSKFGAAQQLGQMVALSVVRELGPVITALLFAGRAGSALTAEIGLMKTTEQLEAMAMMAVDPVSRIFSPRFWAGVYSMPLLAMIFSMVAVYGGYLVGVKWLGVDAGSFWGNMQSAVHFRVDVLSGLIKSIVFGFVVTWISVFQGYNAKPTAAGMAQATTRTVVYSSLVILGLDFILTTMMIGGW